MKPRRSHPWAKSVERARSLQISLAAKARIIPFKLRPGLIAAIDVSYNRPDPFLWAAAVLVRWPGLELLDQAVVRRKAGFPYVPTFLSFRELPACLAALGRLRRDPICVLCDGQGLAHPRFFGLATHLGYLLDLPTVGCAKSHLVGEYTEPGREQGEWTFLAVEGRRVGAVVRTRGGVKPVFVSPGHKMDVPSAVKVVLSLTRGFRLPEPIRRAHHLANVARLKG